MIVRPLLPELVAVAEMDPREARLEDLDEAERACVAQAVAKRQQEFAAGRRLAHELGVPGPLLVGATREPLWPAGIVGSITHCETLAAVAIARCPGLLGIDVEPAGPLPEGLRELVLTDAERTFGPVEAMIVFSAKEAVYKAIHARVRRFVDFSEVVVELDGRGCFRASVPFLPERSLSGRYAVDGGYIATALWAQSSGTSPGTTSPSTGTTGAGTNLGTVPGRKG